MAMIVEAYLWIRHGGAAGGTATFNQAIIGQLHDELRYGHDEPREAHRYAVRRAGTGARVSLPGSGAPAQWGKCQNSGHEALNGQFSVAAQA